MRNSDCGIENVIRFLHSEFPIPNSAMVVGSLHVRLYVRESRTLKDKRQVVRSVLDRLRNQFNVAAAEVGHLDDVKVIEIGVAAVGAEVGPVKGVLQTITEALRGHPVAEYLGGEIEVGRAGDV